MFTASKIYDDDYALLVVDSINYDSLLFAETECNFVISIGGIVDPE